MCMSSLERICDSSVMVGAYKSSGDKLHYMCEVSDVTRVSLASPVDMDAVSAL